MVMALVLLLAGCDRVFGLTRDATDAATDAVTVDTIGDGPSTGVALVRHITAQALSTKSLPADLGVLPAKDHLLVIVGAAATAPLLRPTGGGVPTWKLAAQSVIEQNVEIWYGVTDGSSSAVTIVCNSMCDNNVGPMWMSLSEWSGLATAAPLGPMNAATGTASGGMPGTASAGSITTIDAPNLLVFGVSDSSDISPVVTDWTVLDGIMVDSVVQRAWYRVATTIGPYAPGTTVTSAWDAAIAAFHPAP